MGKYFLYSSQVREDEYSVLFSVKESPSPQRTISQNRNPSPKNSLRRSSLMFSAVAGIEGTFARSRIMSKASCALIPAGDTPSIVINSAIFKYTSARRNIRKLFSKFRSTSPGGSLYPTRAAYLRSQYPVSWKRGTYWLCAKALIEASLRTSPFSYIS